MRSSARPWSWGGISGRFLVVLAGCAPLEAPHGLSVTIPNETVDDADDPGRVSANELARENGGCGCLECTAFVYELQSSVPQPSRALFILTRDHVSQLPVCTGKRGDL